MFRAPLCPSSGAREYYTSGCCLSYLVLGFQVVGMVWSWLLCVRFAGCSLQAPNTTGSDHLYNTLELLMMGIMVPETCWASNKICNKYHLLHLVGILFPYINDDAQSESLQMKRNICVNVRVCCNSRRQKCDQKRKMEVFKVWRPYNINTAYVECKNKSDTSNVRGNWNDVGIIQKIPAQRTGPAGHQRTTENSHTGHCTHTHTHTHTHTAESADVTVQNTEHAK